jgi:sigma-E factor negative regulatory protein RseA
MKAKISALMDGEGSAAEVAETLSALREGGEAREAWKTYHLIGDALRDTRPLANDVAARVATRLSDEPTVFAPAAGAAPPRTRWLPLPAIAASVAAVALVAWVGFGPQSPQAPAPAAVPVAKTDSVPAVAPPAEPVRVPLPSATDDYLLAHQGYSPRNSLQGMAPYVRTVAGSGGAARP